MGAKGGGAYVRVQAYLSEESKALSSSDARAERGGKEADAVQAAEGKVGEGFVGVEAV